MVIITHVIVLDGTSTIIKSNYFFPLLPVDRFYLLHHDVENWTYRKGNPQKMRDKGVKRVNSGNTYTNLQS